MGRRPSTRAPKVRGRLASRVTEPFLADDETTWPAALVDLLAASFEELKAFHKFERDVDRRSANGDVMLRINPPPNPSRPTRERVLDEANAIIADASVVGYHCTRLVDHEVSAILAKGMRPLSVELMDEKIAAVVAAGLVTSDVGSLLARESVARRGGYGQRLGMTWFVFSRRMLRGESGIRFLLTRWGGEATYWLQRDPAIVERLCKLGTPSIIEAAIAVRDIETYSTVGARLLCHYLAKRRVRGEDPAWQGHVEVPTPRVRRIIRYGDGVFEKLTGCRTWRTPL